jgi:hypothetical protein
MLQKIQMGAGTSKYVSSRQLPLWHIQYTPNDFEDFSNITPIDDIMQGDASKNERQWRILTEAYPLGPRGNDRRERLLTEGLLLEKKLAVSSWFPCAIQKKR